MNTVFAKDLRTKECLHEIPNDKPGWYKWWAPKETLEILFDSQYIRSKYLHELLPHLTNKEFEGTTYYYVYVGIAVKESLQSRLNWHTNQCHNASSVSSGFLSTLRQTIASLAVGDQYNEDATNKVIDTLIVEYEPKDFPIRSDEAKEKIHEIEDLEIANNTLPLNIKGNKKSIVQAFKKELKEARKKSKQRNN